MRYVTSVERVERELLRQRELQREREHLESPEERRARVREEGEQIGLRKAIAGALLVKFQRVSDPVRSILEVVTDTDALMRLHQAVIQVETIGEFEAALLAEMGA